MSPAGRERQSQRDRAQWPLPPERLAVPHTPCGSAGVRESELGFHGFFLIFSCTLFVGVFLCSFYCELL